MAKSSQSRNKKNLCTCGGRLVSIDLTIGEATRRLSSCSNCDRRFWEADGVPAKLDEVLGEISVVAEQNRRR